MPHRLTPREREIAGMIAQGLSGPQIARRLVLSIRTVEGHVYRARTKLDVPTRHDLAMVVADSVSPRRLCPDCPLVICDR